MRYLLVSYIRKPDGQYDEIVSVSTKIKKADWTDQRVILDYKEEKVLKAADIRSLIENLTIQHNQFSQLVNENQTKMLETRGAIAVATAQLQGLEDDTKPTD